MNLDKEEYDEACRSLQHALSNLGESHDTIIDRRRTAIVPLVWLLDGPEEEEQWTGTDERRVRKVLLKYIFDRQLDDANISYVLKLAACPSAQLATLTAISRILHIEETPLLNETSISFLHVVVDLMNNLNEGAPTSVEEAASRTLRSVCWKAGIDHSESLVAKMPAVLDVLVQSLAFPVCKSDAFAEDGAHALSYLAMNGDGHVHRIIVNKDGILAGLVNLLYQQDKPSLQTAAAGALSALSTSHDESVNLRIANEDRALVGLVNCLSTLDNHELQQQAAGALANLATLRDNSPRLRIANDEKALVGLVNCLSNHDQPILQAEATRMASNLAVDQAVKAILKGNEGLLEALTSLVGLNPKIKYPAAEVLIKIQPTLAKEIGLLSAQDFGSLDQAADLKQRQKYLKKYVSFLGCRIFVKVNLGDFQEALDDANEALKLSDTMNDALERAFLLQERGILKRIMGDLAGALADLNEGLKLDTNDYETRKHCGYVKFLLNDVEGARADAEWALSIQPSNAYGYVDDFLGGTLAEYLGYKL